MSTKYLLKIWGISLCLWSLFPLFTAILQSSVHEQASFSRVFFLYLHWYLLWGFISPAIILGVFKLQKSSPGLWKSILIHACTIPVILVPYMIIGVAISLVISESHLRQTNYIDALIATYQRGSWLFDFFIYGFVVFVSYALYFFKQVKEKEKQNLELQSRLYKTQLEALRSQLNPHFLFNALNTISGLTRLNKAKEATEAISELSYMLRLMLSEQNSSTTSLENEMIFIRKYVGFQELRFGDKLLVNIDVDQACSDAKVPFLLIHTLVENAVKHGSQLSSNANVVEVLVNCDDGYLNIKVENQICKDSIDDGFGIGLINCQQRLERHYKDNYSFESKELMDNRFCISIRIPHKEPAYA